MQRMKSIFNVVPLIENEVTLGPKERANITDQFHGVLYLSMVVFLVSISIYATLYYFSVMDSSCQCRI